MPNAMPPLPRHLPTLAASGRLIASGLSLSLYLALSLVSTTATAAVQNGIDVLRADGFAALDGLRVGLITNSSGIAADGTPTIDLLHDAPGVTLAALFGPEHGLRADRETAEIADGKDAKTGLPIFSLYNGPQRSPDPAALAGLDALVFDLQDVGVRFYTYISTMGLAMEAAAKEGLKFVVLDRINPIGGLTVDGPLRDGGRKFVAHHDLPIIHGMTVGELAKMFAAEEKLDLDLTVVPVAGWQRPMHFPETGLPWVNPSPNMRSPEAALLYPGIGLLEFTNISVGRGTPEPFTVLGAPYLDGEDLARHLNTLALPGVRIEPATFTPDASKFADTPCHGIRMAVTDPDSFRPLDLGLAIAKFIHAAHPEPFGTDKINTLLLHPETLGLIKGDSPDIRPLWAQDIAAFQSRRTRYLLY